MRSLRRLSVASIVSVSATLLLCSTRVRAQTLAAPPAGSVASPAPFASQIPPLSLPPLFPVGPPQVQALPLRVPPLSPDTIHRLGTPDAQKLSLLARNNGPCYTLRTYGFTPGHDPGEAPRLSTHTTCTPASKSHLRGLVKTPLNSSH